MADQDFAPGEKLFLFLQATETIDILKLALGKPVEEKHGKIKVE